jgi:hypothetical protein
VSRGGEAWECGLGAGNVLAGLSSPACRLAVLVRLIAVRIRRSPAFRAALASFVLVTLAAGAASRRLRSGRELMDAAG